MCPFCDKRGPPRVGWAAKQQELLPHWAEIKHKKHVNKICLNFVGFRGSGKILWSALCSTRAQTQEATCSNTPHGDGLPKHSCSTELSLKYLLIAALLRGNSSVYICTFFLTTCIISSFSLLLSLHTYYTHISLGKAHFYIEWGKQNKPCGWSPTSGRDAVKLWHVCSYRVSVIKWHF